MPGSPGNPAGVAAVRKGPAGVGSGVRWPIHVPSIGIVFEQTLGLPGTRLEEYPHVPAGNRSCRGGTVPRLRTTAARRDRRPPRPARRHTGDRPARVDGAALPGQRVRPVAADRLGPHPRRPDVPARLPAEGDAERAERTRSGQALRGPLRQGRAAGPGAADTRPASTRTLPGRRNSTSPPAKASNSRASSTSTARRCCTSRARARPATRTARTASAGRSSSATANCVSPHRTRVA